MFPRMRWKNFSFTRTIAKYILQELIGPFSLGLVLFTFVLLMDRVLDLIELVVNKGVEITVVLEMVLYIMPSFLVLTIPMGVLVATLTAFGRLSTDSEITAMKASGISLYMLYWPVLAFSVTASALTFWVYATLLPWGNHQFRIVLYELARTKATIGLKQQVFDNTFPGLTIYIDEINDQDKSFRGVMVSDTRDPKNALIIFAREGRLITDEKALRVILRLTDGVTHPKDVRQNPLKYQIVAFPTLDYTLRLQAETPEKIDVPVTDREMSVPQLWKEYFVARQQEILQPTPGAFQTVVKTIETAGLGFYWKEIAVGFVKDSLFLLSPFSSHFLVEIHKRFAFPFACLVFGLIATPLGIQSRRAGKSGGYAISLVLLLIYYIFIMSGESFGDDGKLPVLVAVWTPNLLLGGTGIVLLKRVARQ